MDNRINAPAASRILAAARIRAEAEETQLCTGERTDWDRVTADKLEASAIEVLTDPHLTERSYGGELLPMPTTSALAAHYKDTIKTPSLVTAEASRSRLDLASDAGVLSETLDISETIGAQDALERMLAAQLAALHRTAMRTTMLANDAIDRLQGIVRTQDRESGTIQLNRLVNTIARSSAAFQDGLQTLAKIRSGGKQSITVTHIQNTQVNSGGKAVVTSGAVGAPTGDSSEGPTNKNGQ